MDAGDLRRRREKLGYSQAELARRLGVPQSTLSRWETGKIKIERPLMLDLAMWALEWLKRLEVERVDG